MKPLIIEQKPGKSIYRVKARRVEKRLHRQHVLALLLDGGTTLILSQQGAWQLLSNAYRMQRSQNSDINNHMQHLTH